MSFLNDRMSFSGSHRAAGRVLWCLVGIALALNCQSQAQWTRFRGDNGSGALESGPLPSQLTPEQNLLWKRPVGFARSSPVIIGNEIVLTAMDQGRLQVMSLNLEDGQTRWVRHIDPLREEELYQGNDWASPTPVFDEGKIVVFFQPVGLLAFDREGNELWRLPLGPFNAFYGVVSSPVAAAGKIFLQCDQQSGSFIIAVDADTGRELWRQSRPGRIDAYATPNFYPGPDDPRLVLVLSSFALDAYDIESGERVWELGGLGYNPVNSGIIHGNQYFASTPNHAADPAAMPPPWSTVVGMDADRDGRLSLPESPPGPMQEHFGYADLDKDGFVSESEYGKMVEVMEAKDFGIVSVRLPTQPAEMPQISWRVKENLPYLATPLYYRDVLYVFRDGGIVVSIHPSSGKLIKRGRFSPSAGEQFASAVAGDGKIFIAGHSGEVGILRAGPQWEVLSVNDLGEEISATPALVDRRIVIRTRQHLWVFSGDSNPPNLKPIGR